MTKCAVYLRVSTVGHGQDVSTQLLDLKQMAEHRGYEITRVYSDEGVSGSKDSRPALNEMLADAKRGKFAVLLIWRLDRLGRSLAHLVRLFEDFKAWNVQLVSFSEGLDFTTAMGKLYYQMLGAFAEFERETIRERIHAGLRNARSKGHMPGPAPQSVDVLQLRQMLDSGVSLRKASAQLGISHATALRRLRATA